MSIAVRMPGLDLWKAQVRCQAGCPVAGVASLLPSGAAAFGAASLAFLRFTGGPARGAVLLAASVLLWTTVPAWLAMRRIGRTDI